jgi:hypothetical protein
MKMNRITRSADGASAGITLNAGNMGVYAPGLSCPLALISLKEVKE